MITATIDIYSDESRLFPCQCPDPHWDEARKAVSEQVSGDVFAAKLVMNRLPVPVSIGFLALANMRATPWGEESDEVI